MRPTKALAAVSVVGAVVFYKMFKLPQQDVAKARKMLYKDGKPVVIAHRAGQFEAPENTLVAIDTAYKNGAYAVEVDLDFTADGVGILMHDDHVDRTTNGTGLVNEYSFKNIRKLNAAVDHPYTIQSNGKVSHEVEEVPTLYEAVDKCLKNGMTIDLDIKSHPEKVAAALKDIAIKYPDASEHMFLTSFYPQYLYTLRKEVPEFPVGIIWRPYYLSMRIDGEPRYNQLYMPLMYALDMILEYLIHNWAAEFLGISIAVMNKKTISESYLKLWEEQNVEVVVWTVNNPAQKEYFLNHLKVPIVTDSVLNIADCWEQTT